MARTHSKRGTLLAALILAGGVASAGAALAGPAASAAQPKGSSTFVVGDTGAVDGMNPYVGLTSIDFEVYGLVYDDLMDYGQTNYAPAPRLATSWSVSKDQLIWTYHIRHGVKWSDGVPLTAADVAYTFQRDTVPGSTEEADNSAYVANIVHSSVKAIGKYTVQMRVTKPTPNMDLLIVSILPKHIWEHVSEKQVSNFPNNNPVGSGPFIVTNFKINQSVTLKANPHYWGGKPGISKLIFQDFTNPSAEAIALKNGSIDFAEGLTASLFNSLKGQPGITLDDAPSGNWDELAFNNGAATVSGKPIGNGNPALRDLNVRLAISYALNKPQLVQHVFLGYAQPATTIIPPIYPQYHYTPPPGSQYNYDPKKAEPDPDRRRLEDGAGRDPGQGRQATQAPAVLRDGLADLHPGRSVREGLADRHRHRRHRDRDVGEHRDPGHRQRRLRHVHLGLGGRAEPRLPALRLHLRTAFGRLAAELHPGLVGQLLLQQALRRPLRRAEVPGGPGARKRREGHGEDPLHRRAVRAAHLRQRPAGVPQ